MRKYDIYDTLYSIVLFVLFQEEDFFLEMERNRMNCNTWRETTTDQNIFVENI
jgi:hypothetical protein